MLAWFQQNFLGRSNPEWAKHNDQQNGKIQRVRQRACPGPALFFSSSSSFFLSPPSSSHPAQTPTPAPSDPARQLKCMHVCMHARVRQPECDVIATRRRESAPTNPPSTIDCSAAATSIFEASGAGGLFDTRMHAPRTMQRKSARV